MTATYQLMGAVAILVSLVGTWLAAKNRAAWLLNLASSAMWFPALLTGDQWAAVANCVLSIGICLRNFRAQSDRAVDTAEAAVRSGHRVSGEAGAELWQVAHLEEMPAAALS
jgi:hypothetical protein